MNNQQGDDLSRFIGIGEGVISSLQTKCPPQITNVTSCIYLNGTIVSTLKLISKLLSARLTLFGREESSFYRKRNFSRQRHWKHRCFFDGAKTSIVRQVVSINMYEWSLLYFRKVRIKSSIYQRSLFPVFLLTNMT